jgi:hypothetical protein
MLCFLSKKRVLRAAGLTISLADQFKIPFVDTLYFCGRSGPTLTILWQKSQSLDDRIDAVRWQTSQCRDDRVDAVVGCHSQNCYGSEGHAP